MQDSRMKTFDLIRLMLAFVVVMAHLTELQGKRDFFPSIAAVSGFFCLAGYFCFRSYARCMRDGSGRRAYAIKRLFRIYPAYAAAVLVPVILWNASGGTPFESARFLAANLSTLNFLHPCLGSLFAGQTYCTVNGALWTIKNELILYGSIPLFFWLLTSKADLRTKASLAIAVFVACSAYYYFFVHRGEALLAKQFPSGAAYFLAGSLMAWLRDNDKPAMLQRIEASKLMSIVLIAGIGTAAAVYPDLMMLPAIGPLCLAWAVVRAGKLPSFVNLKRDISYTLYLCHFPIIQLYIHYCGALNLWQEALAVCTAVVTAYCLTRAVELPGIRLGERVLARLTTPAERQPSIPPQATE